MNKHLFLLFSFCSFLIVIGCKKSYVPKDEKKSSLAGITMYQPFITHSSALFTAETKTDELSPVTERGVCWGTSPAPTVNGNKLTVVNDKPSQSAFEIKINGLTVNTKYYARAYAINKAGVAYGNEIQFITFYRIGEQMGGGKIFFVDDTKLHGLIASEYDVYFYPITWAVGNLFVVETGARSVSDGKSNTDKIVARYGSGYYPAKLCKDYRGGGFDDWYLPSKDELLLLLKEHYAVGNFETNYNKVNEYWSSTETSYFQARYSAFSYGYSANNSYVEEKKAEYRVRAIRAF